MSYHSYSEPKIGCMNHLKILQKTSQGLILQGEIILPTRSIPKNLPTNIGDTLEVFVYYNAKGELAGTTQRPLTEVGKFADLQVVEITDFGIFLDWGLPKDLLLPFNEEVDTLQVDDFAIVYTYIDERSGRITATMKYDKYLDQKPHQYKEGDQVFVLVESQTPLGFKVIVDNAYWGLVYKNEVKNNIQIGDGVTAFIKTVRPDGKLDIGLQPIINTPKARNELEAKILQKLADNGGILHLSDKSSPDDIYRTFGISKAAFKRAIGGLFKAEQIVITPDAIRLKN